MSTTMTVNNSKTFEYGFARVKDFNVNAVRSPGSKAKGERVYVQNVEVAGRPCKPTKRFWTSIQCRFGFSSNMFRYFDHSEVFERISAKSPNDAVKYCIEHDTVSGQDRLLAVTNPGTSTVHYASLVELLGRYDAQSARYDNGIVRSTHRPRIGAQPFNLAGDEFMNQFVIDTPVDGFGKPNIYLSLLRIVCTNGMVGFDKTFRSEIALGKKDEDVAFALIRAMDGFNNEEGYSALRERFETASNSWASVNEIQKLYKVLINAASRGQLEKRGRELIDGSQVETALPIFESFHKMSGDISHIYGLANLDALSVKRQRTLPTPCKVYDMLNFATEVATHHAKEGGNRMLQAYVGDLVATEYDLENTCNEFSDWRDFFINNDQTADTLRVIDSRSNN